MTSSSISWDSESSLTNSHHMIRKSFKSAGNMASTRKWQSIRNEKGDWVPVIKIFKVTAIRIKWPIITHRRYSHKNSYQFSSTWTTPWHRPCPQTIPRGNQTRNVKNTDADLCNFYSFVGSPTIDQRRKVSQQLIILLLKRKCRESQELLLYFFFFNEMNLLAVQVAEALTTPEWDHFQRSNVIFCLQFTHVRKESSEKYKIHRTMRSCIIVSPNTILGFPKYHLSWVSSKETKEPTVSQYYFKVRN